MSRLLTRAERDEFRARWYTLARRRRRTYQPTRVQDRLMTWSRAPRVRSHLTAALGAATGMTAMTLLAVAVTLLGGAR